MTVRLLVALGLTLASALGFFVADAHMADAVQTISDSSGIHTFSSKDD